MRYREIINESMSIQAVALQKDTWRSVFPREWTSEHDTSDPKYNAWLAGDIDEEPDPNPSYRSDLDLNLSNGNMRDMMGALGIPTDDEGYHVPVEEFINRAQTWLKQHIGKQTGGRDSFEAPRQISGQNINYEFVWKKAYSTELQRITNTEFFNNAYARLTARKDPRVVGKTKEEWLAEFATRKADIAVEAEKAKNQKPIGPTIIQGGRPAGYLNTKIMQALKIAKEGKEHGATHISAF